MDRRVVPFKPWHYEWLVARAKSSEGYTVKLDPEVLQQLDGCNCWTAVIDGEPVAVAGTIEQWRGRHQAWAYLADSTGPHMRWITREVQKVLEGVKGRIEFTVRLDFAAGHRWARMLGFKVETPRLEKYGPFGEDHAGYVRFN